MKQKVTKIGSFLFNCFFLLLPACANAQGYDKVCFYICAHQDDWQLFMGTNVFNDISASNEKKPVRNGKKVVIIYTTAGNLNDDDDSKACDCRDPYNPQDHHVPYWRVREHGSKNSLHLASCRIGGWGATTYPECEHVIINGHSLAKYTYKNTVSYYLRIKAGKYGRWGTNIYSSADAIDSSTSYDNWADFVNTLYYIYKAELDDNTISNVSAHFNFPDINGSINPGDHRDHLLAGKGACEAVKILSIERNTCFPESLYIDYHSQNLPINIGDSDMGNEAALTGVYCLALLDYNAWPEWGHLYREWDSRNYFRTINSCEWPVLLNPQQNDGLDKQFVTIYPTPANNLLNLTFNIPDQSKVKIEVTDIKGVLVFEENTDLNKVDNVSINTSRFIAGSYLVIVTIEDKMQSKMIFDVVH